MDAAAMICSTPNYSSALNEALWLGFKIIGDNLDRNIKPRHQRFDRQTRSLHFFNSYAVLDRCNFAALSDEVEAVQQPAFDISLFLPDDNDLKEITHNFSIIIGRIAHKYIPAFAKIPGISVQHITHKHHVEMSQKSKVVNYMTYLLTAVSCEAHVFFYSITMFYIHVGTIRRDHEEREPTG